MKYLNDRVFYGCSNISDIDLGTKIEKIGNEVFALSSLKTIKIPNIKSIGERCFFGSQIPVSYTHLRAHETEADLVCRLLLEKKKSNLTMYVLKCLMI